MMDESSVGEGDQAMSSIEVNQEQPNHIEEVKLEDSVQPEEKKHDPDPVPYSRFAEVNEERHRYKGQYEQLQEQVNEYLTNNSPNTQEEPSQDIGSVESPEALGEYLNKIVESKLQPIQQKLANDSFNQTIDSYFANNSEARTLKPQMDAYTKTMNKDVYQGMQVAITKGDTGPLDLIKNAVLLQQNQNINNMAQDAAQSDANNAFSPQATKIVKQGAPNSQDLINEGVKTGNFGKYFQSLADIAP